MRDGRHLRAQRAQDWKVLPSLKLCLGALSRACVKKSGPPLPSASKVAPATSLGSLSQAAMLRTAGAKKESAVIDSAKNRNVHHSTAIPTDRNTGAPRPARQ